VSDEIKLLLNAIISNQEQARARQESFETEIYKNLNSFKSEVNERFSEVNVRFSEVNERFSEVNVRFDTLDIQIRGIRRHVDITEKELDRTIIRVERIEQASH
jgi:hypothetical protein